jgi:hypothetical protein
LLPSYTLAGLPAAGTAGRLARVTDNKRGVVMDNGANWAYRYPVAVAEDFTGADAGARIQAAINALPNARGTVDARGFEGAQSAAATITIPANVRLLLGNTTLSSSQNPVLDITGNGASLLGYSWDEINGTVINNTGIGTTLRIGTGVAIRNLLVQDMALEGGNVAGFGIATNNGGDMVLKQLRIIRHLNDSIRITAGIHTKIEDVRIIASASRLAGAFGIFNGTDSGNTTTTRVFNTYIAGYATSIRNLGASFTSIGNVMESMTDGINTENNGFLSLNDHFESYTGFAYVLGGGATAAVIGPQGVTLASQLSISGYGGLEDRLLIWLPIAGLRLGSDGVGIKRHLSATATLNFGVPAAVPGDVSLTIAVTGAAFGDTVTIGAPLTVPANYTLTGFVSAAATVTIRWTQHAGAAADPDGAGGTYRVDVWKH